MLVAPSRGMDASTDAEMLRILGQIEQAWVDPADADFPQLVGTLTERQRHLARIQDVDVSQLSDRVRETVRERLEIIVARDREIRARVDELRESFVKQATELRRARRGAEGYRRVVGEPSAAFDRTA